MKRNFLITIFLGIGLGAAAQVHRPVSVRKDIKPHTESIQAYADSLDAARDSIFSRKTPGWKRDSRLRRNKMQLFMPLTYYGNVAENLFTRGRKDNPFLAELMRLYLSRPDLVAGTDRALRSQQTKLDEIETPIHHDVKLVEKVPLRPADPQTVPVEVMVLRPNFWTFQGDYALQFLQNYVTGNWYKGGESNYSVLSSAIFEANYNNKQKVKWDNRLELKFGIQSTKSDTLHSFKTTEDLIRLTSKFGLQASKKWYYSVQFVGNTQFTHSYRSNDPLLYSDFLAPLNINVSLGMDYTIDWLEHKLKGNVHLAPLAYNIKYTRIKSLADRLGIENGRHARHDFGSELSVEFVWQLMEALSWKTRLYSYTTYKRTEIEWENTIRLQFNRFIGAQLFIYPRFDDGVTRDGRHGYLQMREFASIGFQYSF